MSIKISAIALFMLSFTVFVNGIPFFLTKGRIDTCKTLTGETIKIGESWHDPNSCSVYYCEVNSLGAMLIGKTCATVFYPSNCREEPGTGLYPDCCNKVVCGEEEMVVYPYEERSLRRYYFSKF
uniref:Venom peptide MmKTx1 n=1 Tax=Olivierus martensii TaxID=34649 RepID=LA1_OLIMR|nr:RecName: Full=Venom peptide MmKTx1; AltName: Full=BmTXLP1; AltName: Full=BmTXLP4; Flags: Precursor [Mesobuthus martensii]ABC86160.1 TXLP4 [Mesobuthus martensii]ABN04116.1 potassium channel toxin protein [Mesobuthus martensii]AFR60583.1 venom peptide MmKTx1 [Mesobuthus martensii]